MPIYTYKHPKKEKYIEIVQGMNEVHEFFDKSGTKWERVFDIPNYSIDSKLDPHNPNDFVKATSSKKGTIGDILDLSKEMSEKRGGPGKDPVLQKNYEIFKKQTGRDHPDVKKMKSRERLKKIGISVET